MPKIRKAGFRIWMKNGNVTDSVTSLEWEEDMEGGPFVFIEEAIINPLYLWLTI